MIGDGAAGLQHVPLRGGLAALQLVLDEAPGAAVRALSTTFRSWPLVPFSARMTFSCGIWSNRVVRARGVMWMMSSKVKSRLFRISADFGRDCVRLSRTSSMLWRSILLMISAIREWVSAAALRAKYDINKHLDAIKHRVNERLGSEIVKDVMVENFNFVTKKDIRS